MLLKILLLHLALANIDSDEWREREWCEGVVRAVASENLQTWKWAHKLPASGRSAEARARLTRASAAATHKVIDLLLPPDHPLWPDLEYAYTTSAECYADKENSAQVQAIMHFKSNIENRWRNPANGAWRIAMREWTGRLLVRTGDPAVAAKYVEAACIREREAERWKMYTRNGRLKEEVYTATYEYDPRIVNERYFRHERP